MLLINVKAFVPLLTLRFVINFPTVSAGNTLTKSCREERRTFRPRSLTVHRNVVWVYLCEGRFFFCSSSEPLTGNKPDHIVIFSLSIMEMNHSDCCSSPPQWVWTNLPLNLSCVFSPSKYNLMRYLWMVFPDVMKKTLNQRQQTTDDEYAWNLTTRI